MNVPVMTMPADEALAKMEEYRDALRANPDSETAADDRTLYRGFKAIAKGMRVLNINDVFRTCPLDEKGRPKLAICRADARWCGFGSVYMSKTGWRKSFSILDNNFRLSSKVAETVYFPVGILDGMNVTSDRWRAMVPSIPPTLRPADAQSNYHILWEAEWQQSPPRDPFLLKHLEGPLYVVVAEWDLTDLEMSVLAHARQVG